MQYLAELTAATLKGCGCALQQNLDKATQDKHVLAQQCAIIHDNCFKVQVHLYPLGEVSLLIKIEKLGRQ